MAKKNIEGQKTQR